MARSEADREDLLAEATALVERVSVQVAGFTNEVVIGFRRDHSASFYLDPQRVYQFNSAGQLRRAFVDDLLYKAERGRLVALRRTRGETAVQLVRHELDPSAAGEFLATMRGYLEALHDALAKRQFTLLGQVPEEGDLIGRISCWLDEFSGRVTLAASPHAS